MIYNNLSNGRKDNIAKFICNLKNKKISGLIKDILIRPKQNKYNFFLMRMSHGICIFLV